MLVFPFLVIHLLAPFPSAITYPSFHLSLIVTHTPLLDVGTLASAREMTPTTGSDMSLTPLNSPSEMV